MARLFQMHIEAVVMPPRAGLLLTYALLAWSLWPFAPAQGQLITIDAETTISGISFQFDRTRSFEDDELLAHMATRGPNFWDRVKRVLPFLTPRTYPLRAVEVQRDVVRLRRFFEENGFPHAAIHYARSRYDVENNRIRLVFAVDEGPPLIIEEIRFLAPDGAVYEDPATGRRKMLEDIDLEVGDRFSLFNQSRTSDQALTWLKDHGHAFARVESDADLDLEQMTARLTFTVHEGPVSYFDQIDVEGNESVSRRIIMRELPFAEGDRFSGAKLAQGQRELFALSLFRTALTEVPEQPVDSTVHVRIQVREARPRLITYQVGYGRESGVTGQGDWTHRNFFGSARSFTTGLVANTGYQAAATDRVTPRLFRGTVSVRQPYLFTTRLSGSVSTFLQYERDPQLPESNEVLGINEREMGVDMAFLYEILPLRTISVQYTWSRALQLSGVINPELSSRDIFNRGNIAISAVLGKTSDYIQGGTGFLVRPFIELSRPAFGSDVNYFKAGIDLSGYRELLPWLGLSGRFFAGRLWPDGGSRDQEDPVVENRFDQIRFYVGGATDLKGWAAQHAGPKIVRLDVSGEDTTFVYEAIGGLSKLSASAELRFPIPGLGSDWGWAVFVGAGRVGQRDFAFDGFRFGTGAGIHYATPVGLLRLDLAYKLNPDDADLRTARGYYFERGAADTHWTRRFAIHLSIGQSF